MQPLLDKGIASRRGIKTAHRETAYKHLSLEGKLPISEDVQDNSIILPLYVPMEKEDVSYIIDNFFKLING